MLRIFKMVLLAAVLLSAFGEKPAAAAQKRPQPIPAFLPMETAVKRAGLNVPNTLKNRESVHCYSQTAYRFVSGKRLTYKNVVYYPFDQQSWSQFMVSSDTKCARGYPSYDPHVWRFIYLYEPHPGLRSLYAVGLRVIEDRGLVPGTLWCRAQKVGFAYGPWSSSKWSEIEYRNKVFALDHTGEGDFAVVGSPYDLGKSFVSGDIQCFTTKEEALKKGYSLLWGER